MTPDGPLHVRQSVFGGDRFWRHLNSLADDRGHEGHSRWLAGCLDQDNIYSLWCHPCDVAVAELLVDREPAVS